MGHREKGEKKVCFQDSDLLAPDHDKDTFVSLPWCWTWARHCTFPRLEARGVRQILVPHRKLSLWSLEGDSVLVACLLHVMYSLLHVMLVSQPLFYILVGVWSCGIWMNALSQQQWAGSMFKHWTSFTDSVILLSYAPSECSRLSLLELNSNSAKVLIARPGMRIHNDAGRTGRYRWAWEQESGVVGGVCTSVFI